MHDEGLVSIDYSTDDGAMRFVYEPDAIYDLRQIIGYTEDVSEGQSARIMIFEAENLMHDLRRSNSAGWHDTVSGQKNAL